MAGRLLGFCRLLREHGFRVTPAHTHAALQAVTLVDIGDRSDFRLALRTVLVSGQHELESFDQLFGILWEGSMRVQEQDVLAPEAQHTVARGDESGYTPLAVLALADFGQPDSAEARAAL